MLTVKDKTDFYVYVYCDPRKFGKYQYKGLDICFLYEPFYVGKGKDNRKFVHLKEGVLKKETNRLKANKILKIINNRLKPFIMDYVNNQLEEDCFLYEELLIECIGRKDLKQGPLTNLTSGGQGSSGKIFTKEERENLSRKRMGFKLSKEGRKILSKAQQKRWNKISKEEKKKFSEKCKKYWTEERRKKCSISQIGKNNGNYGNKWNEEQKRKLSEHKKIYGNFTKNNPQIINPKFGSQTPFHKNIYTFYDLDGKFLFSDDSLTKIKKKINVKNIHFVDKVNFVNGYLVIKTSKYENDDFKIDLKTLDRLKDYKIRYLIGQKLGYNSTLVSYYKYLIYKDGQLLLETYYSRDIVKQFGKQMAKAIRKHKYLRGINKYYDYHLRAIKLDESFLKEEIKNETPNRVTG